MVHYTKEQREELFWNSIDIKGENECWNWNKKSKQDGYGRTCYKGFNNNKAMMAHRISFQLYHKRLIQENMIICHSCDNRLCCNPAHLREGTHKDNSDDKFERGRFLFMKGEINGRAKITNEIAEIIRHRYKTERITQTQLAQEYKINQMSISKVVRGVSYKN